MHNNLSKLIWFKSSLPQVASREERIHKNSVTSASFSLFSLDKEGRGSGIIPFLWMNTSFEEWVCARDSLCLEPGMQTKTTWDQGFRRGTEILFEMQNKSEFFVCSFWMYVHSAHLAVWNCSNFLDFPWRYTLNKHRTIAHACLFARIQY